MGMVRFEMVSFRGEIPIEVMQTILLTLNDLLMLEYREWNVSPIIHPDRYDHSGFLSVQENQEASSAKGVYSIGKKYTWRVVLKGGYHPIRIGLIFSSGNKYSYIYIYIYKQYIEETSVLFYPMSGEPFSEEVFDVVLDLELNSRMYIFSIPSQKLIFETPFINWVNDIGSDPIFLKMSSVMYRVYYVKIIDFHVTSNCELNL